MSESCFINANGRSLADVLVEIEIGFDPFSFTERFSLVSTVLADFDIVDCVVDITEFGRTRTCDLRPRRLSAPHDLVLNTGDRASQRVFEGGGDQSVGADIAENYEICFARDVVEGTGPQPGTTVNTPPNPDALDITGFGIT